MPGEVTPSRKDGRVIIEPVRQAPESAMFHNCDRLRHHMHLAPRLKVTTILTAALFSVTLTAPHADPRIPMHEHVGGWQHALYQLSVPVTRLTEGRMRHFTEHCTTVAVTPGPKSLFVSAWHCFEDYRSTIASIQMVDPHTATTISMKLLETGGSMQEDWALLTPESPFLVASWIPISTTPNHIGQPLIAAGFAPVSEANQSSPDSIERHLLADMACSVIDASSHPPASDCMAKKGASGGAMIALTDSGSARLQGIISAGDSETVSYFYPASSLIHRLHRPR